MPANQERTSITLRPEAQELFRSIVSRHGFDEAEIQRAALEHPELAYELQLLSHGWRSVQELFSSWSPDASVLFGAARDLAQRSLEARVELEQLLAELRVPRRSGEQLTASTPLAGGGMALVYRVRDRILQRELAMKVLREEAPADGNTPTPSTRDRQRVRRFLSEVRLTARLDHPGIVPVHELGVDAAGRPFFTMRLVRGTSLAGVLQLAKQADPRWSLSRVLEVLLKVCDAVAYAHSQGVVHRDLKPANIMVGAFGETYVMDWGLARSAEPVDPPTPSTSVSSVEADEPLTSDGDVLGTPNYMSPEQARDSSVEVGPRSDVYSLGAILYQVLAGVAPYADLADRRDTQRVLQLLLSREPTRIRELSAVAPQELIAIAEKAMSRDPSRRYPDMAAVAADVRAYMDGRVVLAHEHGLGAELRKWLRRNRVLAYALTFALLSVGVGTAVILNTKRDLMRHVRFDEERRLPAELAERAQALWPAVPEQLPQLKQWLADARRLTDQIPEYERHLRTLEARAKPSSVSNPEELADRERLESEIQRLNAELLARRKELISGVDRGPSDQLFAEAVRREIRLLEERIRRLVADQELRVYVDFADPADRSEYLSTLALRTQVLDLLLDDPHLGLIRSVKERLVVAENLQRQSLADAADAWRHACDSIARLPVYGGLKLRPQLGLVPIRVNEQGYWEFTHVLSGTAVSTDERNKPLLAPGSGLVLVLLPGGAFEIGSYPASTSSDPFVRGDEHPRTKVVLEPFFLGKHEVSLAQWYRACGVIPNQRLVSRTWHSDFDPVEGVSWDDCHEVLGRWGLCLPTEAQWEYAARANTDTPWWTGSEVLSLTWRVNAAIDGAVGDGEAQTLAVSTMQAGPFGLHHILGNVSEWVSDHYWPSYIWRFRDGDGAQECGASGSRVIRGGSALSTAPDLRSASRAWAPQQNRLPYLGVRVMRPIDR